MTAVQLNLIIQYKLTSATIRNIKNSISQVMYGQSVTAIIFINIIYQSKRSSIVGNWKIGVR